MGYDDILLFKETVMTRLSPFLESNNCTFSADITSWTEMLKLYCDHNLIRCMSSESFAYKCGELVKWYSGTDIGTSFAGFIKYLKVVLNELHWVCPMSVSIAMAYYPYRLIPDSISLNLLRMAAGFIGWPMCKLCCNSFSL